MKLVLVVLLLCVSYVLLAIGRVLLVPTATPESAVSIARAAASSAFGAAKLRLPPLGPPTEFLDSGGAFLVAWVLESKGQKLTLAAFVPKKGGDDNFAVSPRFPLCTPSVLSDFDESIAYLCP